MRIRRPRTIILAVLIVIILITSIFTLNGLQQAAVRFFWAIFSIKQWIFLAIGLIVGFFIGFVYGSKPQIEKH